MNLAPIQALKGILVLAIAADTAACGTKLTVASLSDLRHPTLHRSQRYPLPNGFMWK